VCFVVTLPSLVGLPYLSYATFSVQRDAWLEDVVGNTLGLATALPAFAVALFYVVWLTFPTLVWARNTSWWTQLTVLVKATATRWLAFWAVCLIIFLRLVWVEHVPIEVSVGIHLIPWLALVALIAAMHSLRSLAAVSRQRPLYEGVESIDTAVTVGFGADFPSKGTWKRLSRETSQRYESLARGRKAGRELFGYLLGFVFGGFFAGAVTWAVTDGGGGRLWVPAVLLLAAVSGYLFQRRAAKYGELADEIAAVRREGRAAGRVVPRGPGSPRRRSGSPSIRVLARRRR